MQLRRKGYNLQFCCGENNAPRSNAKIQGIILKLHPRDDETSPLTGVFATRSSDRLNPLGLHPVTIVEIDGPRLKVSPLEAIDGTSYLILRPELNLFWLRA